MESIKITDLSNFKQTRTNDLTDKTLTTRKSQTSTWLKAGLVLLTSTSLYWLSKIVTGFSQLSSKMLNDTDNDNALVSYRTSVLSRLIGPDTDLHHVKSYPITESNASACEFKRTSSHRALFDESAYGIVLANLPDSTCLEAQSIGAAFSLALLNPVPMLLSSLMCMPHALATEVSKNSFPNVLNLTTMVDEGYGFEIVGPALDHLSYGSCAPGDINGDGYPDLLVVFTMANGLKNNFTAEIYAIFGGKSFGKQLNVTQAVMKGNGFKIISANITDNLTLPHNCKLGNLKGSDLGGAFAVVAQGANDNRGKVYVIFNQHHFNSTVNLANLDGTNGFSIIDSSLQASEFGKIISNVGKINLAQPMFDAFAVGEPFFNNSQGAGFIIYGGDYSIDKGFPSEISLPFNDSSLGFSIYGSDANADLSYSITGLTNLTGLEKDSFMICGHGQDICYVIYSANQFPSILDLNTLNGKNGFRLHADDSKAFGATTNSVFNINGRSRTSLVISDWAASYSNVSNSGSVYVVFGKPTFPADYNLGKLGGKNGFRIDGVVENESIRVGCTVDINGDERGDVILITNSDDTANNPDYVLYGQDSHYRFQSPMNVSLINNERGFTIASVVKDTGVTRKYCHGLGDIENRNANNLVIDVQTQIDSNNTVLYNKLYVIRGIPARTTTSTPTSSSTTSTPSRSSSSSEPSSHKGRYIGFAIGAGVTACVAFGGYYYYKNRQKVEGIPELKDEDSRLLAFSNQEDYQYQSTNIQ